MVLAIILFLLLCVSLLWNVGSFFTGAFLRARPGPYYRVAGPRLDEIVREDNSANVKVAVIRVEGIITGRVTDQGGYSMVEVIKAQLKRAAEDNRVRAVILRVDSPGGEVLASDEIYRALEAFQRESRKPVVASMGSLAASGGYYVSAPCRWIIANELTLTGSIGVIMSSWNYRGLMDKLGLLPETYKSGKFKDMLSGSREPSSITPEERDMLRAIIQETYARFKTVVREGREHAYELNKELRPRGQRLSDDWASYADGRVLTGLQACQLGFVDGVGSFDDAVSQARTLAGIGRANVIEYQQRYDISDLFRLFGQSEAKTVKVELGLEVPKLEAGRLYFLSPTYVH